MNETAIIIFVIAIFVQLKAIEYKPEPGIYPACSIVAWVAFLTGLVVSLISSFGG
jgi:hypothetical protein